MERSSDVKGRPGRSEDEAGAPEDGAVEMSTSAGASRDVDDDAEPASWAAPAPAPRGACASIQMFMGYKATECTQKRGGARRMSGRAAAVRTTVKTKNGFRRGRVRAVSLCRDRGCE